MRLRMIGGVAVVMVVAACGSGDSGGAPTASDAAATTTTAPATPTTAPSTTAAAVTTTTETATTATTAATTTTAAPEPALIYDEGTYSIVWANVSDPFWDPDAGSTEDPFFFIHTRPDQDGFYFALEMYTTGYGALWQGELGDVDIICNEAAPALNSTGICPHFDPDGPGPLGDLNTDFAATGSITINQLDENGYDIVVNEIMFSDGSRITSFRLVGP